MTLSTVSVGLVQLSAGPSKAQNILRTIEQVRKAAQQGAQIVCLQELFASQYFCQKQEPSYFDWAEPLNGPTTTMLAELARELGIVVIAPIFEKRARGLYHNSLVVLGPSGEPLGKYRKLHIPDDPLFFEKYYFTPGDLGYLCVKTPFGDLGTLICWDQWYPEAARLTALLGAQILFYPTAIGWHPQEKASYGAAQLDAWKTAQRAHAIANGVHVVAVNRVGHEHLVGDGIEFWGHSFVCDPFGVILSEAGEAEQTLVVSLDLTRQEEVRRNWPFLRDRRIDTYQSITSRFND